MCPRNRRCVTWRRHFATSLRVVRKYPAFRKKHGKQAATYANTAFRWDADKRTLTLAKMDDATAPFIGRAHCPRRTPTTVTVSRDTAGRYFVSLLVEEEIAALPPSTHRWALIWGCMTWWSLTPARKSATPRFFAAGCAKLGEGAAPSRQETVGSRNREKARRKVARIHARIADRRRDFLHKLSTRIIRENQTICVESLG